MYDELVKRLRICPDYDDGCVNCQHEHDLGCRTTTMREAADAIDDLEFACNRYEKDYKDQCAYLPKWIPVTERLPEGGVYVLAYSADDDYMCVEARHKFAAFQITHWMPLPEAPEEVPGHE